MEWLINEREREENKFSRTVFFVPQLERERNDNRTLILVEIEFRSKISEIER